MDDLVEELNRIRRLYTDLPEGEGSRGLHKRPMRDKLYWFRDEITRIQAALDNIDTYQDVGIQPADQSPWVRYVTGADDPSLSLAVGPKTLEERLGKIERNKKFEQRYNAAFRVERRVPHSYMKQGFSKQHRLGLEDVLSVSRQVGSIMSDMRETESQLRRVNAMVSGAEPTLKLLTDRVLTEERSQHRMVAEQRHMSQKIDFLMESAAMANQMGSYSHDLGSLTQYGTGFGMKISPFAGPPQGLKQMPHYRGEFNYLTASKSTPPVWA